ncbi:hypothetical protein HRbin23_00410 [bacterium HR23]|nr:hypothetical protein HRbin23_00410 [bacterium HR23]
MKMGEMTVREAGRRGGLALVQKYGRTYLSLIGRKGGKATARKYKDLLREWGKRGGRPRKGRLEETMGEGQA